MYFTWLNAYNIYKHIYIKISKQWNSDAACITKINISIEYCNYLNITKWLNMKFWYSQFFKDILLKKNVYYIYGAFELISNGI